MRTISSLFLAIGVVAVGLLIYHTWFRPGFRPADYIEAAQQVKIGRAHV